MGILDGISVGHFWCSNRYLVRNDDDPFVGRNRPWGQPLDPMPTYPPATLYCALKLLLLLLFCLAPNHPVSELLL
jgi:hypothetical protein